VLLKVVGGGRGHLVPVGGVGHSERLGGDRAIAGPPRGDVGRGLVLRVRAVEENATGCLARVRPEAVAVLLEWPGKAHLDSEILDVGRRAGLRVHRLVGDVGSGDGWTVPPAGASCVRCPADLLAGVVDVVAVRVGEESVGHEQLIQVAQAVAARVGRADSPKLQDVVEVLHIEQVPVVLALRKLATR